jgi:transposase-like protein
MVVNQTEFIDPYQILMFLTDINEVSDKDLEDRKKTFFNEVLKLRKSCDKFLTDVAGHPDTAIETLQDYHLVGGSLQALGEGVQKAFRFRKYNELTEDSRKPSKEAKNRLTQGDREIYSKSVSADIDSFLASLDSLMTNISERLYTLRGTKKRF